MKWITALIFGAVLGGVLPTVIDGQSGVWADSWAGWGTYRPNAGGFLFSVPPFLIYYRIDEAKRSVGVITIRHGKQRQPRRFP